MKLEVGRLKSEVGSQKSEELEFVFQTSDFGPQTSYFSL
jgi:hypothetical protein